MFKLISICGILLLTPLCLSAQSQTNFKSETYIGINATGNICRVGFNPSIGQTPLTTTSVGLIMRHVSEPHIGIQLEFNYAGRGWIEDRDSIGTYKRELQVLDIPVTAAFIAGSRKLRFVFTVGPYLSYVLKEHETISIPNIQDYQGYYTKKLDNRWSFGYTGGVSIEFHTGAGVFAIRAAFSQGQSDTFPVKGTYYYQGSKAQAFQGGIMYLIEF